MTKKIQDIIVRKKTIRKSLPQIPKNAFLEKEKNRKEFEKKDIEVEEKLKIFTNKVRNHEIPEKVHKNGQRFMWFLMVISVIILIFIISSYFSSATVYVTPKSFEASASSTIIVSSSPQLGLSYELITMESEMSEKILADSKANVERKAKGKVILYNSYSTVTQRLINNTRLESTEGKIYRIKGSVDIPGYKIIKGVKTPGSIETEVIADMPGAEYNIKISDLKGDFKVYAFKGSTKYDAFYGRIFSDIIGGFIGVEKIVSEEKLTETRKNIAEKLKTDLITKAENTKPLGFDLLPGSYFIEEQNEDDNNTEVDSYIVKTKSILRAFLFKNSDLAKIIASQKLKDFTSTDNVYTIWGDGSGISITGKTNKPWEEKTLSMKIFGLTKIVWDYDVDSFKKILLGLSKKDAEKVIKEKFGDSIASISFTIRPGWNNTFPEKADRIKIENTIVK